MVVTILRNFLLPPSTMITQNVIHLSLAFTDLIEPERERKCDS